MSQSIYLPRKKDTIPECAKDFCSRDVRSGSHLCEVHYALYKHMQDTAPDNDPVVEDQVKLQDLLLSFDLATMVTFASDRATLIEIPREQLIRFYKIVSQGLRLERRD